MESELSSRPTDFRGSCEPETAPPKSDGFLRAAAERPFNRRTNKDATRPWLPPSISKTCVSRNDSGQRPMKLPGDCCILLFKRNLGRGWFLGFYHSGTSIIRTLIIRTRDETFFTFVPCDCFCYLVDRSRVPCEFGLDIAICF